MLFHSAGLHTVVLSNERSTLTLETSRKQNQSQSYTIQSLNITDIDLEFQTIVQTILDIAQVTVTCIQSNLDNQLKQQFVHNLFHHKCLKDTPIITRRPNASMAIPMIQIGDAVCRLKIAPGKIHVLKLAWDTTEELDSLIMAVEAVADLSRCNVYLRLNCETPPIQETLITHLTALGYINFNSEGLLLQATLFN